MCAYRIVGAFQSHSSMDSSQPFVTRDSWGVRQGERFAFYVQSWHEKYGWGNSMVELYVTPAAPGAGGAALVGVRQRMSTLDSKKPWLVKNCFGRITSDHFDFYVKAWSGDYGWGHSVIELYFDRGSAVGLLNGFRQVTSNQGATAPWSDIAHYGTAVGSNPCCADGLAWSDAYQWGYSRLEFDLSGIAGGKTPRTSFNPMVGGFHFPNRFTNELVINGGYRLTTHGLCGGMVFAALDLHNAGAPAPTHTTADMGGDVPPGASRLRKWLLQRQIDSFLVSGAVNATTFVLMTLRPSDHHTVVWGDGPWEMTRNVQFPRLRNYISQGTTVPLGLVGAKSIGEVGEKNHQVLAYGYDDLPDGSSKVYVYDPNRPDLETVLSMRPGTGPVYHPTAGTYRGFFVQAYQAAQPAYRDIVVSRSLTAPGSAPAGTNISWGFTVANIGEFPAHGRCLALAVRTPGGEIHYQDCGVGQPFRLLPGQERAVAGQQMVGPNGGNYHLSVALQNDQAAWMPLSAAPGAVGAVDVQAVAPPTPPYGRPTASGAAITT